MNKSEKNRIRLRRYHDKKRELLYELFGEICNICGTEKPRMPIHRKDGNPHKKPSDWTIKEIENIRDNESDLYVRLCYHCHQGVHWIMEQGGIGWTQMIDIFSSHGSYQRKVTHMKIPETGETFHIERRIDVTG